MAETAGKGFCQVVPNAGGQATAPFVEEKGKVRQLSVKPDAPIDNPLI